MPKKQLIQKIGKSFGSAVESYDVSARLQRYSGQQIMQNLPAEKNSIVLDIGSGTGFFANILAAKYQCVFALDVSKNMLEHAKQVRPNKVHWLNGDMHHLPFQDNSIDIIYSNLVIQWSQPLSEVLAEIKRVLKPGGTFAFTSLLDGTLKELKQAWATVDDDQHVINFNSFSSINEELMKSGMIIADLTNKPVVLEYHSVRHLAGELKGLGANHVPNKARKGLAGKEAWQNMTLAYEKHMGDKGTYPATYQLCTGLLSKLEEF